ncbi:hypothetical protein RND71_041454 [Anisodus tanguticus]|uniref:Uncharacterized protein n=1 Tax=Anisodus tanguticus TaxID=243964 RepID=A0AAE1QXQ1_9SOLA|nr:hypothetical protein RND71_041454 [Anisodus tanguticus]
MDRADTSGFVSGGDVELARSDTTLRLDCFGYGGNECVIFRGSGTNSRSHVMQKNAVDDGCKLVLGLGPTPTICSDDYYPGGSTPLSIRYLKNASDDQIVRQKVKDITL